MSDRFVAALVGLVRSAAERQHAAEGSPHEEEMKKERPPALAKALRSKGQANDTRRLTS
jgi:hypothetical protein